MQHADKEIRRPTKKGEREQTQAPPTRCRQQPLSQVTAPTRQHHRSPSTRRERERERENGGGKGRKTETRMIRAASAPDRHSKHRQQTIFQPRNDGYHGPRARHKKRERERERERRTDRASWPDCRWHPSPTRPRRQPGEGAGPYGQGYPFCRLWSPNDGIWSCGEAKVGTLQYSRLSVDVDRHLKSGPRSSRSRDMVGGRS